MKYFFSIILQIFNCNILLVGSNNNNSNNIIVIIMAIAIIVAHFLFVIQTLCSGYKDFSHFILLYSN